MNTYLDNKFKHYFKKRTPQGRGAIPDIIVRPAMDEHSINVGDNDYLNITSRVRPDTSESEVVMSGIYIGESSHTRLESELASYLQQEACQLTQSGYAANSGAMQSLCDKNTHVYVDCLLHASFRDGIAMTKAKVHPFKHNNAEHLEMLVKKHGHGIIITESLFSVDGDMAPIGDIIRIKKKYHCTLIIDESHSLGLYGQHGMGYCSTFEEFNEIDVITASLAKAFGSRAGIVCGKKLLVDFIREHSGQHIFSSALMNHDIDRISKVLVQVMKMDEERAYLMKISKLFRDGIPKGYWTPAMNDITPIVSLFFKTEEELVKMNQWLLKKNVFASCFIWPATVHPCLRFTLNSKLSVKDIYYILSCFYQYSKL